MNGALAEQFLARHGWSGARRIPLTGDASNRCYVRLVRGGETALLAQSPADGLAAEFIAIAEILTSIGLSAPRIIAAEPAQGLILQEDFGDETFTALLGSGVEVAPLYCLATNALIHLHQQFAPKTRLPVFDTQRFLEQTMIFCDHGPGQTDNPLKRSQFKDAWRDPLEQATSVPQSLLLRDFHAGNLIHLPKRPAVKACGIIDFQDAGTGPVTYDLASLLQDARWPVPHQLAVDCLTTYTRAFPDMDRNTFDISYAVMAAQRHVRVIAVFHRLAEQGKPDYLVHMPHLWRLLVAMFAHPALEDVAAWFEAHLPTAVQIRMHGGQ
ncbi:MAG: hypothetical protein CFH00_00350 [Alphaproteobacteria bacterium MarineAlpha1_Bin1]|nr:MAG: hypothetical protein CFH00_00350 [Alphaproteobacteria bacterium MarineAlpha1_Bin1]